MLEQIRPACQEDAAGITQVHIDTWHTTYRGIIPDSYLAQLSYERRLQNWQNWLERAAQNGQFDRMYVAKDGQDRIIGFINVGPTQETIPGYTGELYAIYILQNYQGRGLGRRLARAGVSTLLRLGHSSMLLWVLKDNPSCRFYEALGGQILTTKKESFDSIELEEIAYGWSDIRILL